MRFKMLAFLLMVALGSDITAQEPYTRFVQRIDGSEFGMANPVGMAYSQADGEFLLADRLNATDITILSHIIRTVSSVPLTASIPDPANMVFDDKTDRLLFFDENVSELVELRVGDDSRSETNKEAVMRHNLKLFSPEHLKGMAYNPESGGVFFLVDPGPPEPARIIHLIPDPRDGYDGSAATRDNRIREVVLRSLPQSQLRAIAFNPTDSHLYVLSQDEQKLFELTDQGDVVSVRDISALTLGNVQNMLFAPNGDHTDDPSIQSLYIMDGGTNSRYGGIVEVTLIRPAPRNFSPSAAPFTVIQTIATSDWTPPSPDASGIAYIPSSNHLLVSDGEVNEGTWDPPIWAGVNVWERTLTNGQVQGFNTLDFSDEPTGVAYNPGNQHLYFTDDTGTRHVYELDAGSDGDYGTSDDIVTSFATGGFGSSDPEGIAYDTDEGHLFVVDGSNREVYEVDPGPNGLFDGVDDIVTNFDTQSLGANDPEGIEFNPDNGHLYILGQGPAIIIETTRNGTYVQDFDISSLDPTNPAGLAYGPTSNDPLQRSLYIVARGVDNNSTTPSLVDGMLYEISIGAAAPSLTLTSPNGGESWEVGSSQNITWNSTGSLANVKLEYSSDDGGNWTQITASTANDGTYSWTIPNDVTTTALVRVSDAADGDPTDESDAVFSITAAPSLTLTSPNGSESWEEGSSQNITWSSTGTLPDVMLEYSTDDGATWSVIVTSTPNDGTEPWTVPNEITTTARVRVSDAVDGDPFDQSDAVFSIVAAPPSLMLTSPNGGESWEVGSSQDITWNFTGSIPNVMLEYSTDDGATWSAITASTPNDGTEPWTVPNEITATALVRVSDAADGNPSDQSDGVFSIVAPPTLTLTSPNGGESWEVGSSQNITWSSTGTLTNVMLEYSSDDGANWSVITASTPNDGTEPWTVPNNVTTTARVRVSDAADGDPSDQSDGVFSIIAIPSLTITSPNGGETWQGGSMETITWNSVSTSGTVRVEYSTDSGLSWNDVTASTSDDGTEPWTLPDIYTTEALVRVSDTDGNGPADTSDAVFAIIPASALTVSFQDGVNGYSGTRDTWIDGGAMSTNNGSDPDLDVDGGDVAHSTSILLSWDLSDIQIGSTIFSVDIILDCSNASSESYEFYEMKRTWVENEATWNIYSSGLSWEVAGAEGSGDRGSTVLGAITPSPPPKSDTISLNGAGVAMVQSWIDNPSSNHGFVIMDYSNSDGATFSSRETSIITERPKLTVTYSPPPVVLVEAKIFLEGPYDAIGDTMRTDLRDNDFIPTTSPYSEDPRSVSSIPENVTDWVLVELRETATGPAIDSSSVFLDNTGRIVADDGTTQQITMGAAEGSYYLVVKHRNHLAVMSAADVPLSSGSSTLYDFTTGTGQYYGSAAKLLEAGVFGMYTGDANGNGQVQNDDKNVDWASQVGGAGYRGADFNLNGQVQNDDKNVYWNANVGAGTQVP